MITEVFMAYARTHLPGAEGYRIHVRPMRLYALTVGPTDVREEVERISGVIGSVHTEVLLRDREPEDLGSRIESHILGEFGHPLE